MLRNTFQLASSPDEILSILNGNGHVEWARRQANLRLVLGWKARQSKDTITGRHSISPAEREQNAVAYRAAAGKLKEWLRRYAQQWTASGKILSAAPEVAKRVSEFIATYPPKPWQLQGTQKPGRFAKQTRIAGPAALNFPSRNLKTPFDEAKYELGLMLLQMTTSEWSQHFYRCPAQKCGTYFVRFRTHAQRPVCSRKCNETPRKRRQRNNKTRARLKAARAVIKELEQTPKARWPDDWRTYIAAEASRVLPANLKFARTFVTQQLQARKLKAPSETP